MEVTSSISSTFPPSFHFSFLMYSNTRGKKKLSCSGSSNRPSSFNLQFNVLLGILFPFRIRKLFSKFQLTFYHFTCPCMWVMTPCSLVGEYQNRASFWKPAPQTEPEDSSEISLPTYWTTRCYILADHNSNPQHCEHHWPYVCPCLSL